jgi:Uma2 family endonuclease
MAIAPVEKRVYTAEEFYELCQTGERYELVKGELREMAPPGEEHGFEGMRLASRFGAYVYDHDLGERDPDTVRGADMAFVTRERLPEQFSPKWSEIIPDLVMEVASPNDSWSDVTGKVQQWLAAGVRIAWVVDSKARSVTVCRPGLPFVTLTEADTLDGGVVAPGFSLPVAHIFAPPRKRASESG